MTLLKYPAFVGAMHVTPAIVGASAADPDDVIALPTIPLSVKHSRGRATQ